MVKPFNKCSPFVVSCCTEIGIAGDKGDEQQHKSAAVTDTLSHSHLTYYVSCVLEGASSDDEGPC